ncbi:MAG: NAD(P)/FAD-dependent oxidoreductase [Deinococcota bacterium]
MKPLQKSQKHHVNSYDVAIIGSGMAGSSLAAILARQGLNVLVFEAKSHPRFAIGESMILETSEVMRAMAELYDVPELAYFSSENYVSRIGTSHGVKRHFSFLHHTEGNVPTSNEVLQAVIPKEPHGHELHIYRQDSDAFLVSTAISYGATILQNTPVTAVDIEDDSVRIYTQNAIYHASYVVDAGGFKSVLAEKFQLREVNLQTHSRAIFTHMVDVENFHEIIASKQHYGIPYDVTEGTLHHVFEGGWLWVIPFNNHTRSTNPLCSVGVMLDPRIYPKREDVCAEDEFFDVIARFPSIQAQFNKAKAVRPWTRTERIQYSSKQIVGDRWALLGHAAGFVDPLFSKGLYSSLSSVSLLAHLLLRAHTDNNYSRQAFLALEHKTLAFLKSNDQLVASAYKSFTNHKLWHTYSVLWLAGAYTELIKLISARVHAQNRHSYFDEVAPLQLVGGGFAQFEALNEDIHELLQVFEHHDETQLHRVIDTIRQRFLQEDWLPQAFQDVLAGKNHLPRRKLRLSLLQQETGFLGASDYKKHFFQHDQLMDVLKAFIQEKLRYSKRTVKQNHFNNVRTSNKTLRPSWILKKIYNHSS